MFVSVELYENLTETLSIKHGSGHFFLPKQSVLVEFSICLFKYWLKHVCFDRTLWKFDRNAFDQAQFWPFFSTKTLCFGRIFLYAYLNIDWNTFVLVELYENLTETLLIEHGSSHFFPPKHFVSVEFLQSHSYTFTETAVMSKYTKKECGIQVDGNCLFAAVLQQIHSVPPDYTASDLRKQRLAEMAKSPEILVILFYNDPKIYHFNVPALFVICKVYMSFLRQQLPITTITFLLAMYCSSFLQPLINSQLRINKVTYKQWCLDMCSDHAWGDQIAATILRYMLAVSTVIKIYQNTCI